MPAPSHIPRSAPLNWAALLRPRVYLGVAPHCTLGSSLVLGPGWRGSSYWEKVFLMAKAGVRKGKLNLTPLHFPLEGHRERWEKDSLEAGATWRKLGPQWFRGVKLWRRLSRCRDTIRHRDQERHARLLPSACPRTCISTPHWPNMAASEMGSGSQAWIWPPGSVPQPTMAKG